MKKTLLIAALSLFTVTANASQTSSWQDYKSTATQLKDDTKSASYQQIKQSAAKLVALSQRMLGEFVSKQPECQDYIAAVIAAADKMQTISLEQIEADYHADGKLPKMASTACYHAKDLLVHPATVVVMAKTTKDNKQQREQMQHEIIEVLMHFDQVADSVK